MPWLHLKSAVISSVGATTCVFGLLVWTTRSQAEISWAQVKSMNNVKFHEFDGRPTFLEEICTASQVEGNSLVLAVVMRTYPDDIPRGYFETARDDRGLQLEYDPSESGILRLAVGSSFPNGQVVPIYHVRQENEQVILIQLSGDGQLRIVTNTVDRSFVVSSELVGNIECTENYLNVADGTECVSCDTKLMAAGSSRASIDAFMNSMSKESVTRRWVFVSSVLILAGLYSAYFGARRLLVELGH